MWRQIYLLAFFMCLAGLISAQADTIYLNNNSFEDFPSHSQGVRGWSDCGFEGETDPDVQPFNSSATAGWGQLNPAYDGNTYLGMVVRENDTYERVGQRLRAPLEDGNCYSFSIHLSSSDHYMSATRKNPSKPSNYTQPAVVRFWGGNDYCERRELLAESSTIKNTEWQKFDFEFHVNGNYSFFMIEAFYKTPTLTVYNGNILLDAASPIVRIACPGEEPLASNTEVADNTAKSSVKKPTSKRPTKNDPIASADKDAIDIASAGMSNSPTPPKDRILKNLDRTKIVTGQTIRIDNLYFPADSATMDSSSLDVLEEIAYFLSKNQDIVIEIAGHTNGRPPHEFADELSRLRAQSVANYLLIRGVDDKQVTAKGYGKRKPLATNKTQWGRERNQRVEIRILSFAQK